MKQKIINLSLIIAGFFLLVFSTVVGVVIIAGALIALPFIKRKIRNSNLSQQTNVFTNKKDGYSKQNGVPFEQGKVIDGEFQEINREKNQER